MSLYAEKGPSSAQKAIVTIAELAMLVLSAWILFGAGGVVVGKTLGWSLPPVIPARRSVILAFSLVVFCRMALTMFRFMRRRLQWGEAAGILSAFALYYLGYAILVLPSSVPLDGIDGVAVGLFLLGSFLNTASEWGRDRFKRTPGNQGRLYTQGLFSLSRHINFFGDVLWVSAYAIVARTPWAWLIPLFAFSFFAFFNAPALDRHLAEHYGEQFAAYAARTKMLIPFVW